MNPASFSATLMVAFNCPLAAKSATSTRIIGTASHTITNIGTLAAYVTDDTPFVKANNLKLVKLPGSNANNFKRSATTIHLAITLPTIGLRNAVSCENSKVAPNSVLKSRNYISPPLSFELLKPNWSI